MQLWLVRHAQPLVAPGTCYGALDVPADAGATRACAERLAQALPPGTALWSSPLQRCEQLRQDLLGLRPDLASKTDARLAEMDFGRWEGLHWDAVGRSAVDAWVADFGDHRPGGGESANAVLQRVGSALQGAQALNRELVWLTHAGVVRAARLWLAGTRRIEQARDWPVSAPGWGEWVCVSAGTMAP